MWAALSDPSKRRSGRAHPFLFVLLPMAASNQLDRESALPADAYQQTVLLVEDDTMIRMSLGQCLKQLGYMVIDAESAEEARSFIDSESVGLDLVVSDEGLRGMSGQELAAHVGQWRPELPMITVSGHHREGPGPFKSGPRRYFLGKPFRVPALVALMQQALIDE